MLVLLSDVEVCPFREGLFGCRNKETTRKWAALPPVFPFFSLLTKGPKNVALQHSSQVTARTLLPGVNKANKSQATKSWPQRLPPASPQCLPHSVNLSVQWGQSYTTLPTTWWCESQQTICPELDTIHSFFVCDSLTYFFLYPPPSSPPPLPLARAPQANTSQKSINIRSSERNTDWWDPSLSPRLFLLLQTELFIGPTSCRRELLGFQQQMQAGGRGGGEEGGSGGKP